MDETENKYNCDIIDYSFGKNGFEEDPNFYSISEPIIKIEDLEKLYGMNVPKRVISIIQF
jgi:hypothetical protein